MEGRQSIIGILVGISCVPKVPIFHVFGGKLMHRRPLRKIAPVKDVQIGGSSFRVSPRTEKYPQFDAALTFKAKLKLWHQIETDRKLVVQHQFLPMVLREKSFVKFKLVRNGKKRKVVLKPKIRPIVEVSHQDAAIYKLYGAWLSSKYEARVASSPLNAVATAYRPIGMTNISASREVMDSIASTSEAWIIKGDFQGFFDNLNYRVLKQHLSQLVGEHGQLPDDWYAVYKSLTQFRTIKADQIPDDMVDYAKEKGRYINKAGDFSEAIKQYHLGFSKRPVCGIPQGTSMSAVMANVYMLDFDAKVMQLVEAYHGLYRRYSDDFVVVLTGRLTEPAALELMHKLIDLSHKLVKLTIEPEKTKLLKYSHENKQIYKCVDGKLMKSTFDYLGFEFDGKNLLLRTKSLLKFNRKYHRSVRKSAYLINQVHKDTADAESDATRREAHKALASEAHQQSSLYYLVNGQPRSFRGYARRAAKEFSKSKSLYHVAIQKQANSLLKAAQHFEQYSTLKYE